LLSGKNGSQAYRKIVDMAYGCIYNIYPNLAVRSGCDRVRRQILADFSPMNTLGFVNSKDQRSVYDGFERNCVRARSRMESWLRCWSTVNPQFSDDTVGLKWYFLSSFLFT